MNSIKRQNYTTLKDELPRLVGAQHATGEDWRSNSRKNEETETKLESRLVGEISPERMKRQSQSENNTQFWT